MIELPESRTISKQLRKEILNKRIIDVKGNFIDHKFTFYYQNPEKYKKIISGKKITNIIDRNYYIEIEIEDHLLTFRDGANIRYVKELPEKSKLLLQFEDNTYLTTTTSMYSFIGLFPKNEKIEDKYYQLELERIGPLDKQFTIDYFNKLIKEDTKKISLKAFLATEQRILGIGNGVVQDILFNAELNPKRKVTTLNNSEIETLYHSIKQTLIKMIDKNGRDTEKDIYGNNGEYHTVMSNKNYKNGCPKCTGPIKKEAFLGGSIYYCPKCQK